MSSMEVRKLQTTAAGTFIITVPKNWVEKIGLKKGDLVSVELDEEGSIVVSPTRTRPVSQTNSIEIEQFKDQKLLELCITASYIQGHDVTEIVSGDKMHPDQKRWVRQAVDGLVGVEITEDYADKVVLQNLIDPSKFEIQKLLERFSNITKAVFQDSIKALLSKDIILAEDAFDRGAESTKLYRLLMRLALQSVKLRRLREDMKQIDVTDAVIDVIAIRELGRMAYYAMRIAQHAGEIQRDLDEELSSVIQRMARATADMAEQSFASFVNKDLAQASSIIDKMSHVRKLYDGAQLSLQRLPEKQYLALSLIVRDIRAVAGYAVALADVSVLRIFRK
jgi:AbrB family looped-hinge helix DNA binding protein